jgi:uncharacterized membrane protein
MEDTLTHRIDFLRSVKLFSLLDDTELASLAALFEERATKRGQLVFAFGEVGDSLFVLRDGAVELSVKDHSGEKIVLATLANTDVFGELSMFDHGPRSATAIAIEDSTLLSLHRDDVLRFVEKTPSAALDLLAVMAQRLREADRLLMGRVTRNLNRVMEIKVPLLQRAANWIAEFSGSMPFLMINAAMFFMWIILNVEVIPGLKPFDPYPFGFLTMSVSLEAIFLSILVLLSQNLQAAKDRVRNDIEYEVNLKAELEISELHDKLHILHKDISSRMVALEQKVKR